MSLKLLIYGIIFYRKKKKRERGIFIPVSTHGYTEHLTSSNYLASHTTDSILHKNTVLVTQNIIPHLLYVTGALL